MGIYKKALIEEQDEIELMINGDTRLAQIINEVIYESKDEVEELSYISELGKN